MNTKFVFNVIPIYVKMKDVFSLRVGTFLKKLWFLNRKKFKENSSLVTSISVNNGNNGEFRNNSPSMKNGNNYLLQINFNREFSIKFSDNMQFSTNFIIKISENIFQKFFSFDGDIFFKNLFLLMKFLFKFLFLFKIIRFK